MSDAVSELTGQEVVAFLSDTHVDPGMACEVFVLAPGRASVERALGEKSTQR